MYPEGTSGVSDIFKSIQKFALQFTMEAYEIYYFGTFISQMSELPDVPSG